MRALRAVLLAAVLAAVPAAAQRSASATPAEIDAFNRSLATATRSMDNTALLALWDEDGISLLPSIKPIVGKPAIASFLGDVMASLAGAHMTKFESACYDVRVNGDWASEWCTEHQIVDLGAGKAPFDGYGKMLFVLHRSAGAWRIHEEMWNQALAPDSLAH
jgi:ketosteroid isomerase-like protein